MVIATLIAVLEFCWYLYPFSSIATSVLPNLDLCQVKPVVLNIFNYLNLLSVVHCTILFQQLVIFGHLINLKKRFTDSGQMSPRTNVPPDKCPPGQMSHRTNVHRTNVHRTNGSPPILVPHIANYL